MQGASAEELWDYHNTPGIFARIQPPWQKVDVQLMPERLTEGAQARFRLRTGPLALTWHALHEDVQPGMGFADRQTQGPFAYWRHEHVFKQAYRGCLLRDRIKFKLPLEPLSLIAHGPVRTQLQRMFGYRHRITKMDLERQHSVFAGPPRRALTVAITGMTGMIGSALATFLRWRGHKVVGISRSAREGWIQWQPEQGVLHADDLEGIDAIVHLAGENLASGRWSEQRKQSILDSRVHTTRLLVGTIGKMSRPPQTFISASGVHAGGSGFLGKVCDAWESASAELENTATRRVLLRLGVVLHPTGGALAKMLPAFQLGLGGPIGGGRQRMPWISLEDTVDIITLALERDDFRGPVELVAPVQATQGELATALGQVLRRPSLLPLPAFAVKILFGEMGEATILGDCVAKPEVLLSHGYPFRWPNLNQLLRHVLG